LNLPGSCIAKKNIQKFIHTDPLLMTKKATEKMSFPEKKMEALLQFFVPLNIPSPAAGLDFSIK